jgi:hypothetical protein
VSQRRTQTAKYWVEDFRLEQSDIEHLYNVLLEKETPLSVDEMALILVRRRVELEEKTLASRVAPGEIYHPAKLYQEGDQLSFSQFGLMGGTVIEVWPGHNPDYGPFSVAKVKLENGDVRMVATGLLIDHPLNHVEDATQLEEEEVLPPEELFIEYGGSVASEIEKQLGRHDDLVRLAGRWFPKSLLADVNIGHLNLAEAILDMNDGGPMTTRDILSQVGMLEGVNDRLAEFSMNYGLQEDSRFDEVGPAGQVLWYLARMEPEGVRIPPERLAYDPLPERADLLVGELAELVHEIRDEHTDIVLKRGPAPSSASVTLTYPHRRAGTLPLSHELRRMFPTAYQAPRIRFTLIDAEASKEIPAWVVRTGGYVYGLMDWFEAHDLPVGCYLTVDRTRKEGYVKVSYTPQSPRKEWIRTARVENDRLRFVNQQWSVSCKYNDLMIIAVEDHEAIDALWRRVAKQQTPLIQIVENIGRELASLNPQGNFHARTLYSAVNLIRRCPPGPILTQLVASPVFEYVGDMYWRLAGTTTPG